MFAWIIEIATVYPDGSKSRFIVLCDDESLETAQAVCEATVDACQKCPTHGAQGAIYTGRVVRWGRTDDTLVRIINIRRYSSPSGEEYMHSQVDFARVAREEARAMDEYARKHNTDGETAIVSIMPE